MNCSIYYDLGYQITYYKKKRMQEISKKIETEDLIHTHTMKRMQSVLATARAGAVISKSSARKDTDQKGMVIVVHPVLETSTTGGFMDQQLNIDAVKQQIEIESLQHKQIIQKMQSLLESV